MRALMVFLGMAAVANAAANEFSSTSTRTHLLELFTSEGCSSCPPAEAWLGNLRRDRGLWRDFVPVAWHVDYWDRLGWKDRFASRDATQRQNMYAARWNSRSVYTPCFVLDGREWQARSGPPEASDETVGVLRVRHEGDKASVHFEPARPGTYEAHAVRLAMSIQSKVTRGENAGRDLRHEFVAAGRPARAVLREGKAVLELPRTAPPGNDAYALAVWVTRPGDPVPLQAVGGLLEK